MGVYGNADGRALIADVIGGIHGVEAIIERPGGGRRGRESTGTRCARDIGGSNLGPDAAGFDRIGAIGSTWRAPEFGSCESRIIGYRVIGRKARAHGQSGRSNSKSGDAGSGRIGRGGLAGSRTTTSASADGCHCSRAGLGGGTAVRAGRSGTAGTDRHGIAVGSITVSVDDEEVGGLAGGKGAGIDGYLDLTVIPSGVGNLNLTVGAG